MTVAKNVRADAEGSVPRIAAAVCLDPLEDDRPEDVALVVTRRALSRLALVAVETGSRFQRDGVAHDPMTWMLAPRRLFSGASAIEACLGRDACLRAVLVHGLSLGLDADPADVDDLMEGEDDDVVDPSRAAVSASIAEGAVVPIRPAGGAGVAARLFTATILRRDRSGTFQAFHASLARDGAEVADRIVAWLGPVAGDAVIVDGFDGGAPLVEALVAPAMRDMLELVAADPSSTLARGLEVNVEQRFRD